MSYLCCWSSACNTRMVLCWSDRIVDGLVDGCSCEAVPEEFRMGPQAVVRFWEAPQDACIVELWLPWHIGSSLSALPWRCCNSAGSGGVGAKLPHPQNARNMSSFMFLQGLTLLSHAPVLGMYPRWLNMLEYFFMKWSPQIKHCILPFSKSTYQGVQSLVGVLVIVIWAATTLKESSKGWVEKNWSAQQWQVWTKKDPPIAAQTTK
jgi:hypothetical protein